MHRHITIIILAFVTALFPHLGFPGYIKTSAVTLVSLTMAFIAYMGYREAKHERVFPAVSLSGVRMPSFKKKSINRDTVAQDLHEGKTQDIIEEEREVV